MSRSAGSEAMPRSRRSTPRRNTRGWLLGFLLLAIGLGAFVLWPMACAPGWGRQPFSRSAWAAVAGADRAAPNPRGKMLRSLVRDHQLRGMNWRQIIDLLGEPDEGAKAPSGRLLGRSEYASGRIASFGYFCGMEPPFGIDDAVLVLRFDRAGHVVDWRVCDWHY